MCLGGGSLVRAAPLPACPRYTGVEEAGLQKAFCLPSLCSGWGSGVTEALLLAVAMQGSYKIIVLYFKPRIPVISPLSYNKLYYKEISFNMAG